MSVTYHFHKKTSLAFFTRKSMKHLCATSLELTRPATHVAIQNHDNNCSNSTGGKNHDKEVIRNFYGFTLKLSFLLQPPFDIYITKKNMCEKSSSTNYKHIVVANSFKKHSQTLKFDLKECKYQYKAI